MVFWVHRYEVELQSDGTLLYMDDPYGMPTSGSEKEDITVSEDQWREFRKTLDRENVWEWNEYYDSDVLDGTLWKLVVKYEDASLHSGGSNSYLPEEEFKLFVTAVRQLLGDKDFRNICFFIRSIAKSQFFIRFYLFEIGLYKSIIL